jgi:hypothetical protein
MQKNSALVATLAILLAVSALLNVIAFQRRNEPERPGAPAGREPRGESAAAAPDRSDQVLRELAALRREIAEIKGVPPPPETAVAPAAPAAGPRPAAPALSPAAVDDPQVAEVLSEQEHFRTFWRDLDRVFNARGKIDEGKYFDTVLDVTLDYLGLPESARPRFTETARISAAELARLRKDHDDARRALPQKDKDNAAAVDAQKRELDLRLKEQSKAAVDRVRLQLDPAQVRHTEFSGRIDRWLREIAPKP